MEAAGMEKVIPVILAGGTGSRLWPLSRELFPKQFHSLFGDQSLLQGALLRAERVTSEAPIILCNEEHRFLVAEQCRGLKHGWRRIILEPEGRSTAPAIALAALAACQEAGDGVDPLLLVLPSDHLINDLEAFGRAVKSAAIAAREGSLVTFGITPTHPETGYGYIEAAAGADSGAARLVRAYVEKPDRATAQGYLDSGDYYWNSGMFVLNARVYLDELGRHCPEIRDHVAAAFANGSNDLDFFRPGNEFLDCPADSIDYAVMEKTDQAKVVAAKFDWSDIGSWTAIWEASARDSDGNHLQGDVVSVATKDSYVMAQNRLVGTIGVENLVVVETSDAVLVAHKDRVQDVKAIVQRLKACERDEYLTHREVFRPWGSYESVGQGERYQVKRIKVKPGESLSLQMHHHRAEHWIVVRGTAEVTRGDEVFTLAENESTYIPLGVTHRLANPGKLTLELIEVQAGAYLGEDDIVRFEDNYGR
jgi:mannose-1-phosphate guanylyltransferase/mannose-6-phosphate isomerase